MGRAKHMFIFVDDEVDKKVKPSLEILRELGVDEDMIKVIDGDYEERLRKELENCLKNEFKPVVFLDKMLGMQIGNYIFRGVLLSEGRFMSQKGILVCNSTHNQTQYQDMASFFSDIEWNIEIGPAEGFIDNEKEEGGILSEIFNKPSEYDVECNSDKRG